MLPQSEWLSSCSAWTARYLLPVRHARGIAACTCRGADGLAICSKYLLIVVSCRATLIKDLEYPHIVYSKVHSVADVEAIIKLCH